MSEGLTHFEWLQAEKARIRSLLSKKASPAALARLPKPIVPAVDKLPPVVLATRHHATNVNRQEGSRKSAAARDISKHFKGRPWVEVDHLRELIDVAARRFKLTGKQVSAANRDREAIAARHVVVIAVLETSKATQVNLAKAMGVSLDTIKNSRAYGDSVVRNYAGYAEKYGAAKEDIYARWPQYRSAA